MSKARHFNFILAMSLLASVGMSYEIQVNEGVGRQLILTQCELDKYNILYPDKLAELKKNNMLIDPVYGRSMAFGIQVNNVKTKCDAESAAAQNTPNGQLTPKSAVAPLLPAAVAGAQQASTAKVETSGLDKDGALPGEISHTSAPSASATPADRPHTYGDFGETINLDGKKDLASSSPTIQPISNVGSFSTAGASVGPAVNTAITTANQQILAANAEPAKPASSLTDSEFGDLAGAQKAALLKDSSIGKALTPEENKAVADKINEEFKSSGTPEIDAAATAEAAKNLSGTPAAADALTAASAAGSTAVDAASTASKEAADAASKAFIGKVQSAVSTGIATAQATIAECSSMMGACPPPYDIASMNKAIVALNKTQVSASSYSAPQQACSSSASAAESLCSMIRSPAAQNVQKLMTIGSTMLSTMGSASETCGGTADLSKVAQTGMTLANMACTGVKVTCDMSCKSAATILTEMQATVKTFIASLPRESGMLSAAITAEQSGGIAPKVVQCEKHSIDIVQFATQALGLMTASAQAKSCKDKLTAENGLSASGGPGGSGSGSVTPSTVTMDQMCKDPANASMSVCKCKTDPTGTGCPGAIAKLGGAPIVKSTGSASQLAGISAYKQTGLSAAAQAALGLDSASNSKGSPSDLQNNSSSSGFGAAATTESSGGANSASAKTTASNDKAAAGSDSAKGKFKFGDFGSLGSAIGGFFGGSKSKSGNDKLTKDNKIAEAKRQIASDKVRSEISSASGRSNWDKVSNRYVESNNTFLGQ